MNVAMKLAKKITWLKYQFTVHSKITDGYEILNCVNEGCEFKAVLKSKINDHIMIHHSERSRPFTCEICGKAFTKSYRLKEHKKRHENKETRPYQCEICGISFAVRNDLYIHKRLSHENKPFASTNKKRPKKSKISKVTSKESEEGEDAGRNKKTKSSVCVNTVETGVGDGEGELADQSQVSVQPPLAGESSKDISAMRICHNL